MNELELIYADKEFDEQEILSILYSNEFTFSQISSFIIQVAVASVIMDILLKSKE